MARKSTLKSTESKSNALKDHLPKHQLLLMEKKIGSKYLNLDLPTKAENIIEGEWTLTKEEKDTAIQLFYGVNIKGIQASLAKFKPTEHFLKIFEQSKSEIVDIKNPSVIDIQILNTNIFKLINVGETKGDKMIQRDDQGRPLTDEKGKPLKIDKKSGDIVFSNNKSNFNGFLDSYNAAYDTKLHNPFIGREFTEVLSFVKSNNFDINLFSKCDLQLYISGKPEDILNMSVSKFYDSCQNLYNGSQNNCLAPNIFDKNSKIAFLKFNTPFRDGYGNTVPFTAFTRCMIRNIRGKIYFDIVYPKHTKELKPFVHQLIEKYSGMKHSFDERNRETYYYTEVGLGRPYFDTVNGVPIKFNPDAKKDKNLQALAKHLKIDGDYIISSDKNLYTTDLGTYMVLSSKEALERSSHYIKEEMIYKQDIYRRYLDLEKFFSENRKKCLIHYDGPCDFDAISVWADEPPIIKKKKNGDETKLDNKKYGGNSKHNITKHNLYRNMKPYLSDLFWEERLTEENILSNRKKLSDDNVEIDLGGGFFAYKKDIKEKL
jgi:hypothetical protein